MLTLSNASTPSLIFVPKNKQIKRELEQMVGQEKKKINYQFELNKEKTILRGETTLVFLKQIFEKKARRKFDWSFATNQSEIDLDHIVSTYKERWRIETGFRVQDEAHILSKSKIARIRFFYFVYSQVLQLLWLVLYKEEVRFKEFLLGLYEICRERNENTLGKG